MDDPTFRSVAEGPIESFPNGNSFGTLERPKRRPSLFKRKAVQSFLKKKRLLTHSSQEPLGFSIWYGFSRSSICSQAICKNTTGKSFRIKTSDHNKVPGNRFSIELRGNLSPLHRECAWSEINVKKALKRVGHMLYQPRCLAITLRMR